MKRSPIGPGAKSIARGSTFAAEGRPLKRTAAQPHPRRKYDPELVLWRKAWRRRTQTRACAQCGSLVGRTGHHIIPLQVLKREGVPRWLWWDTRNHLCLCAEPAPERCHQRHELHVRRVPRAVVLAGAPRALEFAAEVGLQRVFDREYPEARAAC